jgi:hypothetical protein
MTCTTRWRPSWRSTGWSSCRASWRAKWSSGRRRRAGRCSTSPSKRSSISSRPRRQQGHGPHLRRSDGQRRQGHEQGHERRLQVRRVPDLLHPDRRRQRRRRHDARRRSRKRRPATTTGGWTSWPRAPNGTNALRDAWKKSKPEFRDYTTKYAQRQVGSPEGCKARRCPSRSRSVRGSPSSSRAASPAWFARVRAG